MGLDELEKLHSQLRRIHYEITQTSFYSYGGASMWRPPINVLKSEDKLIVCMDIPGVEKSNISVKAEDRRLLISGWRKFPEPKETPPPDGWNILAMEVDYGAFERVIELPEKINPEKVKAEYIDGVLWVTMPLAG